MKASAVSTITKSLPIGFSTLVNYSLLATLGYINLFIKKNCTSCTKVQFCILQLYLINDLLKIRLQACVYA